MAAVEEEWLFLLLLRPFSIAAAAVEEAIFSSTAAIFYCGSRSRRAYPQLKRGQQTLGTPVAVVRPIRYINT